VRDARLRERLLSVDRTVGDGVDRTVGDGVVLDCDDEVIPPCGPGGAKHGAAGLPASVPAL